MAKNPLIRSYPKKVNKPQPKKSAGILDDYAVRKVINSKEGTVEKVPVNANDITNKSYVDTAIDTDINTHIATAQAHSDYLLNNADDTTTGQITIDYGDNVCLVADGTTQSYVEFQTSGTPRGRIGYTTSGDNGMAIMDAAGTTPLMLLKSTGEVGIGTDAPVVKLDVRGVTAIKPDAGSGTAYLAGRSLILDSAGTNWLAFFSPSGSGSDVGITWGDSADAFRASISYQHSADEMRFYSNNAVRGYIKADGTFDWSGDIDGTAITASGTTKGALLHIDAAGSTTAVIDGTGQNFIQLLVGGVVKGYIGWTVLGSDGLCFLNAAGNTANLLMTDAGNLGIGTTAPAGALDITSTTGALIVPRMTTAQMNALTAVNGMIIYDTTLTKFMFYENGAWVSGSGLA